MRGGGGNSLQLAPGRLRVVCMTTATLIRTAYGYQPVNPVLNSGNFRPGFAFNNLYGLGMENGLRVRGGPNWARSDKYTIEAVGDGSVDAETLRGPMLLALLESRFKLQVHVETEQIAGYALVIAKGGVKLNPMAEGGCLKRDPASPPRSTLEIVPESIAAMQRGGKPACGLMGGRNGSDPVFVGGGSRLGALATPLAEYLDAQVVDKTDNRDLFNFIFEFGPDEATPGRLNGLPLPDGASSDVPRGPNIFTALEKLGLKVEPIKLPREFIVVDRLERPTPN
jgi:uncharacterized protein (TIGR03435 family)